MRDWLGDFRSGTLLILDEAHHAAPSSGQKYAIDSQITRAVRDLAPRFEHRLFLSATPHNGHSNSFSALLEILDPQRFCRGVPVKQEDARRRHGPPAQGRHPRDPGRLPEARGRADRHRRPAGRRPGTAALGPPGRVPRSFAKQRLQGETKRKQAAAGLLITGLQQRLLSSIEAFARTLRVHRRTVQRQWDEAQAGEADAVPQPPRQLDLLAGAVGNDDDRATLSEEELQAEEEAQIEAASAATVGPMTDAAARSSSPASRSCSTR